MIFMPLIIAITLFSNCTFFYSLYQISANCFSTSGAFFLSFLVSHFSLGIGYLWLINHLIFFPFIIFIDISRLTYEIFPTFYISKLSLFVIHWLAIYLSLCLTPASGKCCIFILNSCNLSDKFHCSTEKWLYIIIGIIISLLCINISVYFLHSEILF